MKRRSSFSGIMACCALLAILNSCRKNLPESSATLQNQGNDVSQTNMVLTPFGYKNADQVHYLPENHSLIFRKDSIVEIDSKSSQRIKAFGKYRETVTTTTSTTGSGNHSGVENLVPGTYGSGWITDAIWINTAAPLINYFSTSWTVPPLPYTNHGQTVYLFNALQDGETSTSYIIQPVLQYGPSNAGGGGYYSITDWYGGGPSGQYWYGTLYTVSPGTNLQGVMVLTANGPNSYTYSSSFVGYPSNSSVSFVDALPMTYAFETLEAYGIQFWGDYPTVDTYPNTNVQNPDVVMSNINIKLNNGTYAPVDWTPEDRVTDIQQHTNIVTQGSPNGQVDLFFTNPWTPPPAPTINNASSFSFYSQVTSGGGGIRAESGQLVTVTVGAGGPPGANYSTSMNIFGVTFTDGTSSLAATNGSSSKQFTMISSGYVSWTGQFSESNSEGSGYVSVQ
jgi:hypothetical protein